MPIEYKQVTAVRRLGLFLEDVATEFVAPILAWVILCIAFGTVVWLVAAGDASTSETDYSARLGLTALVCSQRRDGRGCGDFCIARKGSASWWVYCDRRGCSRVTSEGSP